MIPKIMIPKFNILIIDDEEKFAKLLSRILILEDYEVACAPNAKTGLALLTKNINFNITFDAIICDVKLPDAYGVDLVKKLLALAPDTAIILLTAYGNVPDAVQTVKNGAYHYLVKGDNNNQIIPILAQAINEKQTVEIKNNGNNVKEIDNKNLIIGQSQILQKALVLAQKVAKTDTTVLLRGETGTGKEVFSQYIHAQSQRAAQPFVAVNCGAISKDILESELFGYKAGAFTGANKDKKGWLHAANHGTLFLDEVGGNERGAANQVVAGHRNPNF